MIKELKKLVIQEVKKEIAKTTDYENRDFWICQNGLYFDGDQLMLRLAKQNKQTYEAVTYKVISLEPKRLQVEVI